MQLNVPNLSLYHVNRGRVGGLGVAGLAKGTRQTAKCVDLAFKLPSSHGSQPCVVLFLAPLRHRHRTSRGWQRILWVLWVTGCGLYGSDLFQCNPRMPDLTGIWVIWRLSWPIASPVSSCKIVGYLKYHNLYNRL